MRHLDVLESRGRVVPGRQLVSVQARRLLATPADAAGPLPLALLELFDTAELRRRRGSSAGSPGK